jgi:ketosteroid isomerase-like protein
MGNEQELVARLQRALAAFNRNNIDALAADVAEDVTYTIRGRSAVSGSYEGVHGVCTALKRIQELTGGTMTAEPQVLLAEGDAIMAYMRVTGQRPDGRTYDSHQAYLYRFRDGKLVEGQSIPVDQHAFEQFFQD